MDGMHEIDPLEQLQNRIEALLPKVQMAQNLADTLARVDAILELYPNIQPSQIAHARRQISQALGHVSALESADRDTKRLEEINMLLRNPGPDAQALIAERREINERLRRNHPVKDRTVRIRRLGEPQPEQVGDELGAGPIGGIAV